MLITVQKVVTETHEIDIQFPAYYKLSDSDYYLVKSERKILNISTGCANGYFSKMPIIDANAKLLELYKKGKKISAEEFGTVYIKVHQQEEEYLPDNDALSLLVNSATFKEAV